MLPPSVASRIQTVDSLLVEMNATALNLDLKLQSALASQLAIRSAGVIEHGVRDTLTFYALRRGNEPLRRYVEKTVSYENSLNCPKIEKILGRWNPLWWGAVVVGTSDAERAAVDSLKAIRDKVAHGDDPGAGFVKIRDYYTLSKSFITKFSAQIYIQA